MSLKRWLRPAYAQFKVLEFWARTRFGAVQSESAIARDAQRFWNGGAREFEQFSHWRGSGIFADEERWRAIGALHLEFYNEFVRLVGGRHAPTRIVEWGSGGGANAVHFAPLAREYVGVDVAEASLAECGRQLAAIGFEGFVPVLISADAPEQAVRQVPGPCDLFLCTYVVEVLPTPEYGLRLLQMAFDLLNEGGLALIQIRYRTASWQSQPKRFGYKWNFTVMTTYWIDEFWTAAERTGFKAKGLKLVPVQPINGSGEYAYYYLQKPASAG